MNWLSISLSWYLVILVIGLIFVPLTRVFFGTFFYDRGYPFAKTIAIIVISYTIFVLSFLKILPFSFFGLIAVCSIWIIINALILSRLKRRAGKQFHLMKDKEALSYLFLEECIFLIAFIGYIYVRGQEPAIRGLEKFMDYGFMQSIMRTDYFPPLDMWLSGDPQMPGGYYVNYYYFGHLTGSMLIKLAQVPSAIGYNLVLATIFAQGITLGFSICSNLVYIFKRHFFENGRINKIRLAVYGLLGTFLINLAGNLHTIYAFTSGYDPDNPVPFWEVLLPIGTLLSPDNPSTYWYPNATRFIPKTIHEFPSYSYIVADLHGHVFDIPFVLLTLALLFTLFMFGRTYVSGRLKHQPDSISPKQESPMSAVYQNVHHFSRTFLQTIGIHIKQNGFSFQPKFDTFLVITIGAMTAIHYMTNALNGPIYLLFTLAILFFVYGLSARFFTMLLLVGFTFAAVSYPFSVNFSPFAAGVGVNCPPPFLSRIGEFALFQFIEGNCQISGFYMLFILWGFFWVGLILYIIAIFKRNTINVILYFLEIFHQSSIEYFGLSQESKSEQNNNKKNLFMLHKVDQFTLFLFAFGTLLIFIPEFFYIKDIYPDHFRANTMFKLGYQAFIMMSIAMTVVLFRIRLVDSMYKYLLKLVYGFFFFFVFIYPFFAFPSYYNGIFTAESLKQPPELDGEKWLLDEPKLSQDKEVIDYFHTQVTGQPTILEAQGDSYTDYNRVSAYTGLPTVAGWWVHQWLWRSSPDIVGNRIPDIQAIYESPDKQLTQQLLQKYNVSYIIVSELEREKYPNLNQQKFNEIATEVFKSENGVASIYKVAE
ncbi:MAG: DUF2298 domain-containing protein [Patescibacteria group bacterium]